MNSNTNFSAGNTEIAQVTNVQKNKFILTDDAGNEINGILKGSFTYESDEIPVVGDYVKYIPNSYGNSFIEEILPRKTRFHRINRGGHADGYVKSLKSETLAANFDYVFIISSLNQNFNPNRIARYVSVTNESGAVPVVVLTKADLCDENEVQMNKEIILAICEKVQIFAVSSYTELGIKDLKQFLKADTTIALIGSSGVGKSTLLNTLSGQELMKTSEIREDGKGRHTTTHRELFTLPCGTKIIDTPGLREIGLDDVEDGINETFSDITDLFASCKFRNCSHTQEPGCAVLTALEDGSLNPERWELYKSLQEENTWGKEKMMQIAKFQRDLHKYSPKHMR